MARKKLNKKVALIGSAIFILLVMAAILLFLRFSGDPQKFMKDGDLAREAARKATDELIKEQEYEKAERSYLRARARAKDDSLRIEILFELADFFLEVGKWDNLRGCWAEIVRIDPENVKARYAKLKDIYIMADSGVLGAWKEVELQASEFIEVVEKKNLLDEDTAQWESFEIPQTVQVAQHMGPYLYQLRGRAVLEIVKTGALTDPEESLVRSVTNLKKAQELEPDSIDIYLFLAQAAILRGDIFASRGDYEERNKTVEQAIQLLEQAVEIGADIDPRATINLLTLKLGLIQANNIAVAQEQLLSFEPQFLTLVDKFDSSAEAFSTLCGFYQHPFLIHKYIDKAIEAIEKTITLEAENTTYAIIAANLYYQRFSIYGQNPDLYKAIEIAQNALAFPDAQDQPGPRQLANKRNRIFLYDFLANCYIEQILEPCEVRTESQNQQWLAKAEQAVHEIEQLVGSGEIPRVVKWRGMLDLAKGNKSDAIRKLYSTYEQLKASGRNDAQLSYALATIFKDTSEVGAVIQFLSSALSAKIDWTKPESRLDYAELILDLNEWTSALSNIDFFDQIFGANQRSRSLRIRTYIKAGEFDKAEEEMALANADDPNTVKLNVLLTRARIGQLQKVLALKEQEASIATMIVPETEKTPGRLQAADKLETAELKHQKTTLAELVKKLLKMEPHLVEAPFVIDVCNNYIAEKKINQAKNLFDGFLQYQPDKSNIMFYKKTLSEPEPLDIPQQRRREIEKEVILGISDPIRRTVDLGAFYYRNNEPNEAVTEFKKVIEFFSDNNGNFIFAGTDKPETANLQRLTISYLFEIANIIKDQELTDQMVELAQRGNVDECNGQFVAARFAKINEQYQDALEKIDECLRQKPVFSQAYRFRSTIHSALENYDKALEDARKATSLNPKDGSIAKTLAFALYRRDKQLGNNITSDQIAETRTAWVNAQALNPLDLQLASFYAELMDSEKPDEALALRQSLQEFSPSIENAIQLGDMAVRRAVEEDNEEKKEAYFAMAASAYEQARAIDPKNKVMLNRYATYYQITNQPEQAKQLLEQFGDLELLWKHYYQVGQFGEAKKNLEQLSQSEPNNPNPIKGLVLIAEKTSDKQAVEKYSDKLLEIQDNAENRLLQIQTFLKIGLVKEVEYKLQSFREKHPDDSRVLLLETWFTMKQGQLNKALELANRTLETNQDNNVAWRLRGEVNRFLGNYDQAIIDLKKSKSLADNPATCVALAKAYFRTKQNENAIIELKNAIDRPQSPTEARTLLENAYWQFGRKEELRKFYDETLEKFPNSVFWYNRAGATALAESDFERAEQLYGLAWKQNTTNIDDATEALHGYLQALILAGKSDKVIEEAQKYVDSEFAPVAFLGMAQVKLWLGDKATAIQYCRKAVDKANANEDLASWALQRMYTLLGLDEAISYCKEKLQNDPDSLSANFTMYNFTRLNEGPDSPDNLDYIIKKATVLQLVYNKTSDKNYLRRAVTVYESLLTKMPNNTNVLNNLAYMLAENDEKLPEALEYAEQAYELRPNDPGILDTYGYVLCKNGKYSEAKERLLSARQQFEQKETSVPADVYEHLGMVEEKLGAEDSALEAYEQALAIGADKLPEPVVERIKKAVERLSSK
ncbi:MAG: tetratricopeptide repeat protein [Planctomycetota bacterium]|jgi:tetratricopeptide (TPR) repeat protein